MRKTPLNNKPETSLSKKNPFSRLKPVIELRKTLSKKEFLKLIKEAKESRDLLIWQT